LDNCFSQFRNGYKASSGFGKSDHTAIFLIPEYKQKLVQAAPERWVVKCRSAQSEAVLQDVLDDVDWDMFRSSSTEISEFVDVAVSFVGTLVEELTQTITIKTFLNHGSINQSGQW